MLDIPVYILAGGRSSRFGTDKARARLGDETLLEAAARPFRQAGARLTAVAEVPDKYQELGFRTLGDRTPEQGPLGGLITALHDLSGDEWLMLTACDFVGARVAWVDRLADRRAPGARAVAFRPGRWEPLFALYHRGLLEEAAAMLSAGERALWRLLERVGAVAAPIPPDWERARSIDTPAALAEYRGRANHAS